MFKRLISYSIYHPKIILALLAILVAAAVLQLPHINIDTDPENMLSDKEFVRVFHHEVKKEFGLYDFIILGIVNEDHLNGVFNVDTLNKIYEITEHIKGIDGVITREIISPSTKDNIRQGQMGEVIFEWLMKSRIKSREEALRIRDEAMDNPMFKGTLVSEDAKALCIYVPIKQKDISYRVSQDIYTFLKKLKGPEKYYITGLPVAEDTFGVEMFKQMAISAPLAGLIIFLLMFVFFRNIAFIVSPMILAISTVLVSMGALIGFGVPVHIMSSMIPIFLMPIAVLDSVHILSEFFDKYKAIGDKRRTIIAVMDELFKPMLFTSLTSAVGFFSLSFAPIPPVQAFGIFVAMGIMLAWLLTVTFIPAYISLLSEKGLGRLAADRPGHEGRPGAMDKFLAYIGVVSGRYYKLIIALSVALVMLSALGIARISVNDNPVKWFTKKHPIRVADEVLNRHFGGTYTAYLVLSSKDTTPQIFKEPSMLRYVEGLQRYLIRQGDVGKTTTLADVVKKVYYELLGGDRKNNVIPKTKAAVAQCLISYENSHKPDDLWHMATPDYSKLNFWVQLKSGDNRDMEKVLRQVDEYISKNQPPYKISHNWAGLTYINVIWQNKMVVGMLKNFIGSFIIVFFMMTFLFRSPIRGLISMIPLTITILFIYSLLGFLGRDYDMPVAVLSALTLGLSIDFAIHFIQRSRDIFATCNSWRDTVSAMFREPGRAIVRNALVVAIGFLPLLFAPLMPYRTVGFFMFTIMLISSVATLIILPAIMTAFPGAVFEQRKEGIFCNRRYCLIISIALAASAAYVLIGYMGADLKPTSIICVAIVIVMTAVCPKIARHKPCVK